MVLSNGAQTGEGIVPQKLIHHSIFYPENKYRVRSAFLEEQQSQIRFLNLLLVKSSTSRDSKHDKT